MNDFLVGVVVIAFFIIILSISLSFIFDKDSHNPFK